MKSVSMPLREGFHQKQYLIEYYMCGFLTINLPITVWLGGIFYSTTETLTHIQRYS